MNIQSLQTIRQNFTAELEKSQAGEKTSLPFIINQLPAQPLVKDGESFYVLVIGGSIYQYARCKKKQGQIIIEEKEAGVNPPFISAANFFHFIEEMIPNDVHYVALNFAYPLEPVFSKDIKLDGRLIRGTKEYTFDGLIGKVIGEEIERYLLETRQQNVIVSVANDTICELLSGLSNVNKPDYLACGIVGTGVNFAYFIDPTHAVNLEAANFDKFPQSKYGNLIDKTSQHPGTALLEKETSGGYLYQHFNIFAKEKGINIELSSSKDLDEYAKKCDIHGDMEACRFAFELLDHSAALIAAEIAGIVAHKKSDMNFIMAGSLFWKGFSYKETVSRYVKELVPDYTVTFIAVESCEIYGAARLIA